MSAILLGKNSNENLFLDIPTFLKTRLLVQANSGGGKSFLLRRLAEQLFGKVPVIIIDIEGEFSTLREKYGYVLVGSGGETPADVRSAAMVAHKLLELRASAVCDLYELKPHDRHRWVRLFLEALIDSPKNLWGSTVVIVDEAHQFCPEGKAGESEASSAMVDLTTRGRKRGFCAVFATQRLGKLRKDAAAELLNVMVGMTFIDIDRDRAAECLGVTGKDKHGFNDEIKLLTEGKFYCLGRAICKDRTLIKVGGVETTHPEAGGGKFTASPPPPPEVVKAMLPKLADLPKAAEEKAKTESELRQIISNLKREITGLQKMQPTTPPIPEPISILTPYDRELLCNANEAINSASKAIIALTPFTDSIKQKLTALPQQAREISLMKPKPSRVPVISRPVPDPSENGELKIGKGAREVLKAIAGFPDGADDGVIAVLTGYKKTSRTTFKQQLSSASYINRSGENYIATDAGIAFLGSDFQPLPVGDELRELWMRKLSGGELELFKAFVENYPSELTMDQLMEVTNYKKTSITTFKQKLSARKLICDNRASANLFS